MNKTFHLSIIVLISALCVSLGTQPGLAASEVNVEAEAAAEPEAKAAAKPQSEAEEEKVKKEKKPGRWAETGRPPGREISDRWGFWVGTYGADVTTDAAIGSGNLLGTTIRIEDDLGLSEDDQTYRAQGFYRFNPRHGLDFGYWSLKRSGTQLIDEDFQFQDKLFNLGASIDTDFDTSWFRLAYKYSMVNNQRAEAGITAGLSTYQFKLALKGEASLTDPNGVATGAIVDGATESILAPVPTFGFFLTYAMRPRLLFKLKTDYLDLRFSDLEGTVLDSSLGVEWFYSRHAGIGLMHNTMNIEVKDTSDSPWSVDYKQRGWVAYFSFVFGDNADKKKANPS